MTPKPPKPPTHDSTGKRLTAEQRRTWSKKWKQMKESMRARRSRSADDTRSSLEHERDLLTALLKAAAIVFVKYIPDIKSIPTYSSFPRALLNWWEMRARMDLRTGRGDSWPYEALEHLGIIAHSDASDIQARQAPAGKIKETKAPVIKCTVCGHRDAPPRKRRAASESYDRECMVGFD